MVELVTDAIRLLAMLLSGTSAQYWDRQKRTMSEDYHGGRITRLRARIRLRARTAPGLRNQMRVGHGYGDGDGGGIG